MGALAGVVLCTYIHTYACMCACAFAHHSSKCNVSTYIQSCNYSNDSMYKTYVPGYRQDSEVYIRTYVIQCYLNVCMYVFGAPKAPLYCFQK